ncbi:ImmA/IrrE family metallo-endopeptidase [Siminovitchia terrae]|uniref:ImmA/IrrE family metallo-endopeptidase n=1 Tax=Siminovitchia terrae TaxID=1914933 RepID=UPI0028AF1712|nr:ImmA/IrrE family metallo-endopeptidase [Siminovitchia terrae]
MYYSYLEDFIKYMYQSIGINTPTELDMKPIASYLNIELQFWDEPSEAIRDYGTPWIFINEKLSLKEQWQDFGHELCHVLQHVGNQRNLPVDFRLYQEVKAENFMYHFCVPTFMLEGYQVANYFNIDDGLPIIAKDFNVTEEFAKTRLIHYRNKIQQAKSDNEHRKFMERLYPKAPPYNDETNKVLDQLNAILMKKGAKA